MKRQSIFTLFLCLCAAMPAFAGNIWHLTQPRVSPSATSQYSYLSHLIYKADEAALRQLLHGAAKIIDLPLPDGSFRKFSVTPTDLLPPALAARYPDISTYRATATDNPGITATLDFTVYGFHAMIYDGDNTALIDPATNEKDGLYTVHYKRAEVQTAGRNACAATGSNVDDASEQFRPTAGAQAKLVNGYVLRKYRLALSCSHQYAQAVTGVLLPTKAEVLSKMTTTMNRVNGIYEQEVAVTMQFVEKEDTLIFPVAAGDPFGPFNASAGALIEKNQAVCDTLIGDANYDIGHVFSTGGGGLSQVGVVCRTGLKAQCVTGRDTPFGDGFDVDFVAHEIGHEYGADHSFNNNKSSNCSGNAVLTRAYEPGSGSTIMAYAGICPPDNLQPNSDFYFHGASVQQIYTYINTLGDGCAQKSNTGYKLPGIANFNSTYTMPCNTPFELIAPTAVDSSGDSTITYCWEEWDLGGFGLTLTQTTDAGPLFRSYTPSTSPVRTFPSLKMIKAGVLSNAGVNNASGEKIPEVTRALTFRLSLRGTHNGSGCFHMPDDSVRLFAINTGQTFSVTSQNTTGISYTGYSQQQITWNVAGTRDAPINASKVDIYLSTDSASTWSYFLGSFPNTGEATVSMPNPDNEVHAARIKVKGSNNVFFNINSKEFSITHNYEAGIRIYPVPAHDYLHIQADNSGVLKGVVFNSVGQVVWQGVIDQEIDMPAYLWGRGLYILKLIDAGNRSIIRKFSVN